MCQTHDCQAATHKLRPLCVANAMFKQTTAGKQGPGNCTKHCCNIVATKHAWKYTLIPN